MIEIGFSVGGPTVPPSAARADFGFPMAPGEFP